VVISEPSPSGGTAELASNSHEPPALRKAPAAAEARVPGLDSVDEVLEIGEEHLRAAELEEALEMAIRALRLLEDARDAPGIGTQTARAEVMVATVHIAHARKEAAIRSFQRALRADEHLELDPSTTSPKVLDALEEAQSELDWAGAD
jgi:tetratricopeptide (TPR) repeat protein